MKEKEEGTGDSIQSAWFLTLPFKKNYSSEVQDPWPDRLAYVGGRSYRNEILPLKKDFQVSMHSLMGKIIEGVGYLIVSVSLYPSVLHCFTGAYINKAAIRRIERICLCRWTDFTTIKASFRFYSFFFEVKAWYRRINKLFLLFPKSSS